jgi:hypothetical protein
MIRRPSHRECPQATVVAKLSRRTMQKPLKVKASALSSSKASRGFASDAKIWPPEHPRPLRRSRGWPRAPSAAHSPGFRRSVGLRCPSKKLGASPGWGRPRKPAQPRSYALCPSGPQPMIPCRTPLPPRRSWPLLPKSALRKIPAATKVQSGF